MSLLWEKWQYSSYLIGRMSHLPCCKSFFPHFSVTKLFHVPTNFFFGLSACYPLLDKNWLLEPSLGRWTLLPLALNAFIRERFVTILTSLQEEELVLPVKVRSPHLTSDSCFYRLPCSSKCPRRKTPLLPPQLKNQLTQSPEVQTLFQ